MRAANLEFLKWMENKGVILMTGRHPFDQMFDHTFFRRSEVKAEIVWQLINDDFHGYLKSMMPILSTGQVQAIVKMYEDLQSGQKHIEGYYSEKLVLDLGGQWYNSHDALGCQGKTVKGRRCGNIMISNSEQTLLKCGAFIEGLDIHSGNLFRWFCEHHEYQREVLRV